MRFLIALSIAVPLLLLAPVSEAGSFVDDEEEDCGDQYADCLRDALDSPADSEIIVDKQLCDAAQTWCEINEAEILPF